LNKFKFKNFAEISSGELFSMNSSVVKF